jgi:hypothetical protein
MHAPNGIVAVQAVEDDIAAQVEEVDGAGS